METMYFIFNLSSIAELYLHGVASLLTNSVVFIILISC